MGAHLSPRKTIPRRAMAAARARQSCRPNGKDAFVAQAKASRITGNKWNVKIDGATFEPVEAPDKAAAIEAAYALYAESFSDPSQGEDKQ